MAAVAPAHVAPPPAAVTAPAAEGKEVTPTTSADSQDTPDEGPALANLAEKQKKYREAKPKKEKVADAKKTEAAATETEKPPEVEKPDAEAVTAEALFADEALSTPEGLKRAREVVMYAKTELEKGWRQADRVDARGRRNLAAAEAKEKQTQALAEKVGHIQRAFHEKLSTVRGDRVANPMQIMANLDYLAGGQGDAQAGHALLEACLLAVGRDGKPQAETEGEKRLRLQFERVEAERRQEREQGETARLDYQIREREHGVAQREFQIGSGAVTSGSYPGIAGFAAKNGQQQTAVSVGKWVSDYVYEAAKAGERLDVSEALSILEDRLSPYAGSRAAQAVDDGDQSQTVASAGTRAHSGARQSTVLPSDADRSSGASRKETPEERRARMARDPELLRRLGPVIANAAGLR